MPNLAAHDIHPRQAVPDREPPSPPPGESRGFDVLITCNYSPWSRYSGGGQKSVHMLATAMAGEGRKVCVLYSKAPWERVMVPEGLAYHVEWAPFIALRPGISSPLRFLNGLTFLLKARRLSSWKTLIIGNGDEASLLWRVPRKSQFLFTSRNTYTGMPKDRDWSRLSTWVRAILREPRDAACALAAHRADGVVFSSTFAKEETSRCFGLGSDRTRIVPNGIDGAFMKAPFREEGQRGILFFGRLTRNKGADLALDVFARLPAEVRRAHPLTFAGEGPLKDSLARKAEESGLSDCVVFAGWLSRESLAREVAGHRLVLLPSLEESFGNAIVETLACGQNLVTTRVCSIPEVAGPFGRLVDVGDPEGMAAAVREELERIRPEEAIEVQRTYFAETFSWQASARKFLALGRKAPEARAGKILVGLRYDDFSATSPTGLESRILELCSRYRLPCTFAVIPALREAGNPEGIPLTERKAGLLRRGIEDGTAEAALHGYFHAPFRPGIKSEFAGAPAEVQAGLIKRGKAELEALLGPVRTFVPPWNAYDARTLEALDDAGIEVVSGDSAGAAGPRSDLRFVPATCLIPDLPGAVAQARRHLRTGAATPMVVAFFHPYEFRDHDPERGRYSVRQFEDLLAWLAAQPDVEVMSLGDMGNLPEASRGAYARYSRLRRLIPPPLERFFRPGFQVYPFPALRPNLGRRPTQVPEMVRPRS